MKKKNTFKIAVFVTIIVLALILGLAKSESKDAESDLIYRELQDPMHIDTDDATGVIAETIEVDRFIVVDVSGEVNLPGVYSLREGSRIIDAIEIAGGLTENADIRPVNRAELISDGVKIYIPSVDETSEDFNYTQYISSTTLSTADTLININSAGSEELQRIPGVGPVTAEKIIAYRTTHGKFSSVDDLLNISGIGNKTLEKMKGYITVK